MIVDGPLTVEAVSAVVKMIEFVGVLNRQRACELRGELHERVLAGIADGHPRSAAIAKAALRVGRATVLRREWARKLNAVLDNIDRSLRA